MPRDMSNTTRQSLSIGCDMARPPNGLPSPRLSIHEEQLAGQRQRISGVLHGAIGERLWHAVESSMYNEIVSALNENVHLSSANAILDNQNRQIHVANQHLQLANENGKQAYDDLARRKAEEHAILTRRVSALEEDLRSSRDAHAAALLELKKQHELELEVARDDNEKLFESSKKAIGWSHNEAAEAQLLVVRTGVAADSGYDETSLQAQVAGWTAEIARCEIDKLCSKNEDLTQAGFEFRERLRVQTREIESTRETVEQQRNTISGLRVELDKAESDCRQAKKGLKKAIRSCEATKASLDQTTSELKSQIEINQEFEDLKRQFSLKEARLADVQRDVKDLRQAAEEHNKELSNWQDKYKLESQTLLVAEEKREKEQKQVKHLQQKLDDLRGEHQATKESKEQAEIAYSQALTERNELRDAVNRHQSELASLQEVKEKAEGDAREAAAEKKAEAAKSLAMAGKLAGVQVQLAKAKFFEETETAKLQASKEELAQTRAQLSAAQEELIKLKHEHDIDLEELAKNVLSRKRCSPFEHDECHRPEAKRQCVKGDEDDEIGEDGE